MSSDFLNLTPDADLVELTPGQLSQMAGVKGLAGNDTINGSIDAEVILGNGGRDILNGGGGDDVLMGGRNNDFLGGGDGNDLLIGGWGDDQLEGGAGNDTLIGNMGGSILWGDRGADIFVFDPALAVPAIGVTSDSSSSELPTLDVAPYVYIKDFNVSEGDQIALTGGITASDLVLFRANAFSSNPALRGTIIGEGGSDSVGGLPEISQVTVITIASTGGILGVVRDVSPDDLSFISVSDASLML